MKISLTWQLAFLAALITTLPGCWYSQWGSRRTGNPVVETEEELLRFREEATHIEFPDVDNINDYETSVTARPHSLQNMDDIEYWDLPLEEAIRMGMQESRVMRDLGGIVLRTPAAKQTQFDPSIQETDPRFGAEAALSAFDTSFASSAFFEYNDRALNNVFAGGGTNAVKQDLATFQTQLAKKAVTGTEFAVRNNTEYDANNSPANLFPSAWETILETEIRHPFLFGGGVDFNRIAGPTRIAGIYNGVLIARVNNDIALADFEQGVRNFVSEIENAYWDLYYAYRNLEAKVAARDSALEIWRRINALNQVGRRGGEADKEAQAREQYYRFEEEVQNALSGKLLEGTRNFNGSSGGTFRANSGVYVAERRLRMMIGLPISDQRLIRTADEPTKTEVLFNWEDLLWNAMHRRSELRKQKFAVKRREMELEASKKFLQPQLDAVGRYRWRGFGRDLFEQHSGVNGNFNNAWGNLTNGTFQEWQLGAELTIPIGFRRAHAAVRNAELRLARARALLREQERNIVLDLSNAVADKDRAFTLMKTSYNARNAAKAQLEAVQASYDADKTTIDVVLESQRRLADGASRYYRALVEYDLAIKNVHFESGSLLDYDEIRLQEGLWPAKAYQDAYQRFKLRSRPLTRLQKLLPVPPWVSRGFYPVNMIPASQLYESDGQNEQLTPQPLPGDESVPPVPEKSPSSASTATEFDRAIPISEYVKNPEKLKALGELSPREASPLEWQAVGSARADNTRGNLATKSAASKRTSTVPNDPFSKIGSSAPTDEPFTYPE